MDPLVWSALLLLVGLALVMVEVFIPSGGILGFLSIGSLVAGIVLAFYHRGTEVGLRLSGRDGRLGAHGVGAGISLVAANADGPAAAAGCAHERGSAARLAPAAHACGRLVGKLGVAKSVMLPSGAVVIDGQTIDALSEGMPIEAGQRVRVIEVRGNRVVVRPAGRSDRRRRDDVLSQPIESLGLDSLDDPLA